MRTLTTVDSTNRHFELFQTIIAICFRKIFTCFSMSQLAMSSKPLHQSISQSHAIWIINCCVTVQKLDARRLSIGYRRVLQIYDDAVVYAIFLLELAASRALSHRGTLFAPRVNGNRSILSRTIYFRSPWGAIGACLSRSIDRSSINYTGHVTPAETLYFPQRPQQNSTDLSVVNLKNMHHVSLSLSLYIIVDFPPFPYNVSM